VRGGRGRGEKGGGCHNETLVRTLLGKEGFNNDDSTTYLDSEVRG
jgi:hypothetical protein